MHRFDSPDDVFSEGTLISQKKRKEADRVEQDAASSDEGPTSRTSFTFKWEREVIVLRNRFQTVTKVQTFRTDVCQKPSKTKRQEGAAL
jgi:hypothetical protein